MASVIRRSWTQIQVVNSWRGLLSASRCFTRRKRSWIHRSVYAPCLIYLSLVTGLDLYSSLLSVSQSMPHLRYMQPFQGYEQRCLLNLPASDISYLQ